MHEDGEEFNTLPMNGGKNSGDLRIIYLNTIYEKIKTTTSIEVGLLRLIKLYVAMIIA